MDARFSWKTKFFSRKYEIFQYDTLAGELNKQSWSRKSYGKLNGRGIVFVTKRLFKPVTEIIDLTNDSVIGSIISVPWKRKATIKYQDNQYSWQFENFWNTRWSVSNENGVLIKYQSRRLKGSIDSYTKDEVLILAGFFIRNYFIQRSSAAAAA